MKLKIVSKNKNTRPESNKLESKLDTREAYLEQAGQILSRLIASHGGNVAPYRVSVGFPGGRTNSTVAGICWPSKASDDGKCQIFVAPVLDDTEKVLGVLLHQLIHACNPSDTASHGKEFGTIAKAIMEGPLPECMPTESTLEYIREEVVATLGSYPHAKLNRDLAGEKTQGTRLIKCLCPKSGYNCRITKTWINQYGAPVSPVTGKVMKVVTPKPKGEK